ncbi:gamma-glutamyl-gamma-aminobutyrate hydrolase family protein [Paenibacillus whitsoniae]|nr:gamma-glutamyl-gamma-aminobutyrate hydrolase family protein [Paenibacillus whitsoniae]
MTKPLIGILPLYDTEKESYWMLPGYMQGIEDAGGIPVMLPLTTLLR